jgi:predicted permease
MILFLRCLFLLVLASMLAVTSWASFQCPLFAVPREVYSHPWFIATMADTYWGFLTFYVWVAYKQTSGVARGAWLVAILLLGNIAMSVYCLAELFRADAAAGLGPVLTARRDGPSRLGLVLAALGVIVIALALPRNAA